MAGRKKQGKGRDETVPASKSYKINIPVLIVQEGQYYIAYCPVLELSSYGETEDEAKEAFGEALHIFIEETERKGTLEKILLELGWTLRRKPSIQYQLPEFSVDLLNNLMLPKRKVKKTIHVPLAFA